MAEDNGNSFLWFLAGLGVGAAVGVLYAPKSGAETRADILNKFEESREFVNNKTGEVREQAGQWVQRGKEAMDQQKEQFRSAFQAGKQAFQEATNQEPGPQKL